MGDIIGQGFDMYVQNQVIKRQEKLKYGQTDIDVIKWNNANSAFLRLSSGVNVSDNFATKKLGLASNTYNGNLLAKHFKLFAAQTYNADSGSYGFTKGVGYNFNSSYGFTSPEYTSYGLVPPPGITSATIKSLNRGSLREATINIKCHSLQQFQIIEALYLRLKYSLLLEWGHNLYFNNKGELTNSTHDLSETFLNGSISQTSMLTKIQKEREASDGNYDAFFGLVTNFDWTITPDGGYDINLIARASGDVIESLKINSNIPSNTAVPTPTSATHLELDSSKSTLNRLLWSIAVNVNDYAGLKTYAHGLDDGSGAFRVNNSGLNNASGIPIGYTKSDGTLLAWNEATMYNYAGLTPNWMGNRHNYIKLGTLLRIIESFLVFYNSSQSNDPIFKIDYDYLKNYCFTFPRHASIDPRVCLIPYPATNTAKALAAGTLIFEEQITIIKRVYFPSSSPLSKDQAKTQELSNLLPGAQTINIGGNFVNITTETTPWTDAAEYTKAKSTTPGVNTADIWTFKDTTSFNNVSVSGFGIAFITGNGPNNITGIIADLKGSDLNKVNDAADEVLDKWEDISNLEHKDAVFGTEYITWSTKSTEYKYYVKATEFVGGYGGGNSRTILEGIYSNIDPSWKNQYQANYSLTYTIQEIRIETIQILFQKFNNTGATGVNPSVTGANIYKDLEKDDKPGFKDLTDTANYKGRTMEIRVNMEHIAKTLAESIDDKDGTAKLYDFLKKLLSGIQNALGNVNNFEIIYNEDTNTFKIIDNTFIPGLFQSGSANQKKIVEFLVSAKGDKGFDGGSFVYNMNFRTKLSNAFATMATIGAQANGATVGEDATALSKWNTGLTDRIIERRIGSGPEITENTDVQKTYIHNMAAFLNIINKTNDGTLTDAEVSAGRNAATDIFKTEISAYSLKNQNGNGGITPLGFIPFDLELNMMGLSGPRIYESYTIDTRLLPQSYKDAIQFICSGISHTISNGEWKTTLNSICGPRQEGQKITGMKKATPAKSSASTPTGGNSGCSTLKPDQIAAIKEIDKVLLAQGKFKTVESRIGILAVIGKESGYRQRREDSYSGTGNKYILDEVFGPDANGKKSGFRNRVRGGKKLGDLTDAELTALKKDDKQFFNWVYNNSSGNIPETDDGYNFRGGGFNQLTGRSVYQKIKDFTGIDYINNPDLIDSITGAAAGASYFFGQNNASNVTGTYKKTGGSGDYRDAVNIDAAIKAAAWANGGSGFSITKDAIVTAMNNALNCKDALINLYKTDVELQSLYHYS